MVRSSAGVYLLAALHLAQPESATLSGTVVDSNGGRLPGVEITVSCGSHVRTGRSDAEGRFRVDDLVASDCLVVARRPFFAVLVTPLDLRVDTDVRLSLEVALESEMVVTPSRGTREAAFAVPEAVGLVTSEELETRARQILPEMLRDETAVLPQQTTPTQGSPFIRGLSAQRILCLIDGVRFNTSSFRSGATQFLAWVSPAVVDRIEVLRGPASVQYGSDALGGTIHLLTTRPALRAEGPRVSGRVEGVVGSSDTSGGVDARPGVRVASRRRDTQCRRAPVRRGARFPFRVDPIPGVALRRALHPSSRHQLHAVGWSRRLHRVRWSPSASWVWLEGGATFALAQYRLSPGDLADARIGALRTRDTIADFFGGTAVDLGLVVNGVLLASGESLEQVQHRVLEDAGSAPLFVHTPGFLVVSANAGFRLAQGLHLTLFGDNLTDRNYRWHGSGVDAAGASIQLRTSYAF